MLKTLFLGLLLTVSNSFAGIAEDLVGTYQLVSGCEIAGTENTTTFKITYSAAGTFEKTANGISYMKGYFLLSKTAPNTSTPLAIVSISPEGYAYSSTTNIYLVNDVLIQQTQDGKYTCVYKKI